MARQQTGAAPAAEETKTRTTSDGVLVGRAADRLLKLDVQEQEALAQSPATIKETFAKKRADALKDLSEAQKAGALAMAAAMRPKAEVQAAE